MAYPVTYKAMSHLESMDEAEYRVFISVWQTSRNTKHALRRLRDDPDFYDAYKVLRWRHETRGEDTEPRWYDVYVPVPLDATWIRTHERRLRKQSVSLKKLRTPTSDAELHCNFDSLRQLAQSCAA